jgi:L-fuculose-phosphate aldolase
MTDAIPELIATGRRMSEAGLVTGTAGNVSVRSAADPDTILLSPTSVAYDAIAEADVCHMSLEAGEQVGGNGSPSSEWPMHRLVYQMTGAGAVVHTHSLHATAVSALLDELPAIHYYILMLGGDTVRVAPFEPFGSQELADAVATALAGRNSALLQNHGAISHGETLSQAYFRAEMLEWLCELYLTARSSGTEPRALSSAELDGVRAQQQRRATRRAA